MKVLITGSSGFVGIPLVRMLTSAGHEVHVVSRRPGAVASSPAVFTHQADLLNPLDQQRLIDEVKPSHLCHLAWFVVHGEFWTSLENINWLRASLNLLQLFQRAGGRRWVGAGTFAEYDWSTGGILRETSPIRPMTMYGSSKAALQIAAEGFGRQTGLEVSWGRIFNAYGPGEPEGRLVPTVARALIEERLANCTLGTQIRDYIHVEDVAQAFFLMLESAPTGVFNVGTGVGVRVAEIAESLASLLDRTSLLRMGAIPTRAGEADTLVADAERLSSLGFRPAYNLRQGLEHTLDWWKRQTAP